MPRILIGAPVRQDEETFKKYLESLNNLDKTGLEVDYFFCLHNSPKLANYLQEDQYVQVTSEHQYIRNEISHFWSDDNLNDVVLMKNFLLDKTKFEKYDYFFLIDSDLILHPNTLQHLIKQKKDIIAEIFWTQWKPNQQFEPNAWIYDHYAFDTLNTIDLWKQKGVYEVGGTGACILINRNVIEAGVNYTKIKNVSFSTWEDRAFCIRASVKGFEIFLDTHYPAIHLYRKGD